MIENRLGWKKNAVENDNANGILVFTEKKCFSCWKTFRYAQPWRKYALKQQKGVLHPTDTSYFSRLKETVCQTILQLSKKQCFGTKTRLTHHFQFWANIVILWKTGDVRWRSLESELNTLSVRGSRTLCCIRKQFMAALSFSYWSLKSRSRWSQVQTTGSKRSSIAPISVQRSK